MRRSRYLTTLTMIGVVATGVTHRAQQERAALAVQQITDDLYVLGNAPEVQGMGGGGNTAIFITDDGVALVDTKTNGYGQDIIAAVGELTDKPITHVINTHTHFDHSGGNIELPETVNFVVHENTLAQMSRETCEPVTNCDAFKGDNAKYLPQTTFADRMTLFGGPDAIDLYYFGRGHTDGDTWIVFRGARTLHTGDMFARKGLPFLDVANGNGSALEFGETLRKAVAGIPDVDIIIPGHTAETLVWDDLVNYSTFYNGIVDAAKAGQAAGQSVEDVVGGYSVPVQLRDFAAEPDRLQSVVQYVFDGQ